MIQSSPMNSAVSACCDTPIVGAIYRHYKGNCYKVIALSRHSETHEIHVVYQALYDSPQFGDHAVWVRPLPLFMDSVLINGVEAPRFSRAD